MTCSALSTNRLAKGLGGFQRRSRRASILITFILMVVFAIPLAPSATAKVTTRGGPVGTKPHVYAIFWGSNWNKNWIEEGTKLVSPIGERGKLETMYNEISGSPWQGILTQYWSPEGFISPTLTLSSYTDTIHGAAPTAVNATKMRTEISEAIAANGWPKSPSPSDQFVLFTAPGTTYELGSTEYCGYHSYFSSPSYVYAFVPWGGREGPFTDCSMTIVGAHEYAEAATDPFITGWRQWYTSEEFEIADMCGNAPRGFLPGGREVPAIWDEQAGVCSTSDPNPPQMAPEILTEGVTGVTNHEARLHGSAKLHKLEVDEYAFEYGTSKASEHTTPFFNIGTQSEGATVAETITGLAPTTKYHYRVVFEALETGVKVRGEEREFETTVTPGAPKNTKLPVISPAAPRQGVPETTTNGSWTEEPTSFKYQWLRCDGGCEYIGATTPTYVPTAADVGKRLQVWVRAINSFGEATAISTTSIVKPPLTFSEYPLPVESFPKDVAKGPDGNVWFTNYVTRKIGKITPSGTITEYSLSSESNTPTEIVAGSDGNLWFTEFAVNKIGKITPSGTITEYPLLAGSGPYGITKGPDGNIWFTNSASNKIGKITTSGTITEYSLQTTVSRPYGITAGPDGNLWFTESKSNKIGKITTSGTITEYGLPAGSEPYGITAGPDGSLWFTNSASNKIGKITTSGTITEYSLPVNSKPQSIAVGPDGSLWFTEFNSHKIGSISTAGAIAEYSVPSEYSPSSIVTGSDGYLWYGDVSGGGASNIGKFNPMTFSEYALPVESFPKDVAKGPDGNVWFTTYSSYPNRIGKITPSGTITEYALPKLYPATEITVGLDGNMWFTTNGANAIGKITTSGTITEYALPAGSKPQGIVAGPEGNLWFTNSVSNKIGKITYDTGTITEYALPAGSKPFDITKGPDGNLWFAESQSNKIGKITTAGTITEYALPAGSEPYGITAGPDGNLWFTDSASNKIGKITTAGAITEYTLPMGGKPQSITTGPDGSLWFTEYNGRRIGSISTGGAITEYSVPSGYIPSGIATGSDGYLWYGDFGGEGVSNIGKFIP